MSEIATLKNLKGDLAARAEYPKLIIFVQCIHGSPLEKSCQMREKEASRDDERLLSHPVSRGANERRH